MSYDDILGNGRVSRKNSVVPETCSFSVLGVLDVRKR